MTLNILRNLKYLYISDQGIHKVVDIESSTTRAVDDNYVEVD